jgi:glycosyltransferase involved in cell wall biosynthesis
MNRPAISIIMPVYNAEKYISEAIQSVLHQTYTNWELLIINDGSTDNSYKIIKSFSDSRIRYFEQPNQGVSTARNIGLQHMQGNYFCFLDADDWLPDHSLSARLEVFQRDPDIEFVDGCVQVIKDNNIIRSYKPKFKGNPFNNLVELSESCFFGISWMIKINKKKQYQFSKEQTHAEDLLFYINISQTGKYDYTNELIYINRKHPSSAITNLNGLEEGYFFVLEQLKNMSAVSSKKVLRFKKKIKSIMFKSYLRNGKISNAFKVLLK